MKKIIFLCFFSIITCVFAQEIETPTVEKSVTGIQVGLFGADVYNEAKLADNWVLRSQFSLNPSIWGGDLYSKTGFALSPSISLSPKYYYNLKKRSENGKNTTNNSANYLALKMEYFPNWFVLSSEKGLKVNEAIYITPNFGIRRNFAKHFNYEFRAGFGFGKIFKGNYSTQTVLDLSLKVGYDF